MSKPASNDRPADRSGARHAPVGATLVGGTAVLMWATLALFTTWTGRVPPFLLVGLSFSVATALFLCKWLTQRRGLIAPLRLPPPLWLLGVTGLFGYHFFYYTALKNAPPAEAGLIAYLWPLLIVLFSAFLPGERLRWFHIAGAAMGFAGAALLITDGAALSIKPEYAFGYGAAIVCALTWSAYSVLSRRFPTVPSDSVGGFCAVTAMLGFLCHFALGEPAHWPADGMEWLAVLALGLGPVGFAFFTWDHGVKHGDIRALGAFSYAAPLLSTIILVVFGKAPAAWPLALACILITGGAVLAAHRLIFRR
jgi:drug/metabolite transporter (DMT)-like permease